MCLLKGTPRIVVFLLFPLQPTQQCTLQNTPTQLPRVDSIERSKPLSRVEKFQPGVERLAGATGFGNDPRLGNGPVTLGVNRYPRLLAAPLLKV